MKCDLSELSVPLYSLISFEEFHAFEGILSAPDAMYLFAFQLFDTNGSGYVTCGKLKEVAIIIGV